MNVTIGISAYNEAQNIGNLLNFLRDYPFEKIVVASGCTDDTVKIAKSFSGVKVIVEEIRKGKASAVNEIIHEAGGDIIILEGADTIPSGFCFNYLLEPIINNPDIGMVGAHPIPVNKLDSQINKIGHLLWRSHHQMALKYPKAGEVIAFRNKISGIDPATPVDEAYIEFELVEMGYKVAYAPDAIIFNRAPENRDDFIKQRKRIFAGHLRLKEKGYQVHTMNTFEVIAASWRASHNIFLLAQGGFLELRARHEAVKSMKNGYNPTIWERVSSTKQVQNE